MSQLYRRFTIVSLVIVIIAIICANLLRDRNMGKYTQYHGGASVCSFTQGGFCYQNR